MRFRSKEKAKLDSRRKLWSLFGWYWAYKQGNEGETKYTSDENKANGYGFFNKNHSLKCGCSACKWEASDKKMKKKKNRMKIKNEARELMKVINNQGEIE